MRLSGVLSVVVSLLLTGVSSASITVYNTRASFNANSTSLSSEDFENSSIPNNFGGTFASGLNSSSSNAYFNPGDIASGIEFRSSFHPSAVGLAVAGTGFGGQLSKVLFANMTSTELDILIGAGVTAFGLDVTARYQDTQMTVTLFDSANVMLGSTTVDAFDSGVLTFVGFTSSGSDISRIRVDAGVGNAEGIDNVSFGSFAGQVPEPGSILIWSLLAIVGCLAARRFSRRAKLNTT